MYKKITNTNRVGLFSSSGI